MTNLGKALAVAGCFALLADASCPNQCSGHGRCGPFDKCICFKSAGSASPYRYGYTGADCSIRSCPLGTAYGDISTAISELSPVTFISATGSSKERLRVSYRPEGRNAAFRDLRRDQTFIVKIMTKDATTPSASTYTWKFDEDEYYQPEMPISIQSTTALASNPEQAQRPLVKSEGATSYQTGVSVFFDPTYKADAASPSFNDIAAGDIYRFTLFYNEGKEFLEGDSNTAHQLVECSGRGECDGAAGKCRCHAGFTGSACERTECPNDCSGHGTCQSEARFVTDAGVGGKKYDGAYDGAQQYGCKCDSGYRGADCSQTECPSGEDPLGGPGGAEGRDCSGRGICDYSSGICRCFAGYSGESCGVQSSYA